MPTVEPDPVSATMDLSTIVNEVVQHFSVQAGVDVTMAMQRRALVSMPARCAR